MKFEVFELPAQALPVAGEGPSVTALHAQEDGSLLCGLLFAKPSLFRIRLKPQFAPENLELEDALDNGIWGVAGGARSTSNAFTALGVLHEGFAPGFLRKLSGGDLRGKWGKELLQTFADHDGGFGVGVRHSVVQIDGDDITVRRYREPGAILDAARSGDFVFGLSGSQIWREPYLNTEKREVLRKDLQLNMAFHRDGAGNFWLLGEEGRLLRLGQTDIKAKPTTLKFPNWQPGMPFDLSAASPIDEWLYGVANAGRTLFRARVNPVSGTEELQTIREFEERIAGLGFVNTITPKLPDVEELRAGPEARAPREMGRTTLVVSVASPEGAKILTAKLAEQEDPEMMEAAPQLESQGQVTGVSVVGNLTTQGSTVWGGEGRVGFGEARDKAPRLVKIAL